VADSADQLPLVICLFGPTAAGKTAIAIDLLEELPCEIVSVDSAMVYRSMDIGTAKPDAETLARAPHRLVDIRQPWESYSAGDFCVDAELAVTEIAAAGNRPLLTGGTMMYFNALQQGLAKLPVADERVRAEINARALEYGWPVLHLELQQLDPAAAARIKPLDAQRIQRALEVITVAGKSLSELQRATKPALRARYLNIGLMPTQRALLHQRIEQRFAAMLDAGFIREVEALLAMPEMSASAPSMRAVGYRQLVAYLTGECSLDQAVKDAIVATRRLAKRQMTWIRSMPDVHVVDSDAADCSLQVLAVLRSRVSL
jgi:tRNA dimethylallyltransferase